MKMPNLLSKIHIQLEYAIGLNVAMIGATVIEYSSFGVPGFIEKFGIPGDLVGIVLIMCGCFIMTKPEEGFFILLSIPVLFYIVMSFLLFVFGAAGWFDVKPQSQPMYLYFYGGYYFFMMASYLMYIRSKTTK